MMINFIFEIYSKILVECIIIILKIVDLAQILGLDVDKIVCIFVTTFPNPLVILLFQESNVFSCFLLYYLFKLYYGWKDSKRLR